MWLKRTLTTAINTVDLGFVGRGAIFVEGTFGGGSVLVKPKTDDTQIATNAAWTMDGSTTTSLDLPSGLYRFELSGSVGATVDLWYNTQVDLTRDF